MPRLLAWSGLRAAAQCIRRPRRLGRPRLAGRESRLVPRSGTRCVADSWIVIHLYPWLDPYRLRLESAFDSGGRGVTRRAESLLKDRCIEYIIKPGRQNH